MRVLVTGGAGFIGSHLVDAFLGDGHEVCVVDDLSGGEPQPVPPEARFVAAAVGSPTIRSVMEQFRPEVVCHHAAQVSVARSVADPVRDAEVNVIESLHLLGLCREVGVSRVLFASTGGALYGEQDTPLADESHPERPASPYGIGKLAVEHYLRFYAAAYGLRSTSLRYANVYGPRQSPRGEAGVVAIVARRLLAGEPPIIHGDGGQTRDFVYVADVVRANLLALASEADGAFNVGTGVATSVSDLCVALGRAAGVIPAPVYAPARAGEQRRSCLDASAFGRATGWRPETPLDAGLQATLRACSRPPA